MIASLRPVLPGLVVLLLLPLAQNAASAQTVKETAAAVADAMQSRNLDAWSNALLRQPSVQDAMRSYRFNPDRLNRTQERTLAETFTALFPDRDPRRHHLNQTQATALVYMALVHPTHGDVARRQPRRASCETAVRRVYQLDELFAAPGRGQPRDLRRDEQQRVHAEAREIERLARSCGEDRLEDEAARLVSLTAERQVAREQVTRQVHRMQALARLALGF
jgi:hypothetical protein